MTLKRSEKRVIRELVNKACAARVRITNLDGLLENPTQEAMDYASDWRTTLANGLDRTPKEGEPEEAPKVCECPPGVRNITDGGHFPACTACHRRLKA